MCITTQQQDTKSIPNPNVNPATKQHAVVGVNLNNHFYGKSSASGSSLHPTVHSLPLLLPPPRENFSTHATDQLTTKVTIQLTSLVSSPMRAFQCSRKFSICFSTNFQWTFLRRRFSRSCNSPARHKFTRVLNQCCHSRLKWQHWWQHVKGWVAAAAVTWRRKSFSASVNHA